MISLPWHPLTTSRPCVGATQEKRQTRKTAIIYNTGQWACDRCEPAIVSAIPRLVCMLTEKSIAEEIRRAVHRRTSSAPSRKFVTQEPKRNTTYSFNKKHDKPQCIIAFMVPTAEFCYSKLKIRYTRCYFNVRPKGGISQLVNLPSARNEKLKSGIKIN